MNKYNDFVTLVSEKLGSENVKLDEPMSKHTTFKVGGKADIMVFPSSYKSVQSIVKIANDCNINYMVIGKGSNLLVKDGGIRGVVINLTKLNNILAIGEKIICGTGASLYDVANYALKNSLSGFEFACGIPGCVGGAVTMNAGAYISEISNVIESALVLDSKGDMKFLSKDQLELGYRMSSVIKYDYVVLEAIFKFHKSQYEKIESKMKELQTKREEKQPLEYPSAGSTFKRPEGYYAAKLIEDSGLKGAQIGGAKVSLKHSGFIINEKDATAEDILNLIEHVKKTVEEKFNVKLYTEVRVVGEDIIK